VCDLETSRMVAPYIYDISHLKVNRVTSDTILSPAAVIFSYTLT